MNCYDCQLLDYTRILCQKSNAVIPGGLLSVPRRKDKKPRLGCTTLPVRTIRERLPEMRVGGEENLEIKAGEQILTS